MAHELTAVPASKAHRHQAGLGLWMHRVLEECDKASVEFAADPVHDLRVALRRCRSMADGLMAMDPDPAWKRMKKAGKRLFSCLGELRDVQVMREWVERLGASDDAASVRLRQFLSGREGQLKLEAAQALNQFDRKQWKRWSVALPKRARRIRIGGVIFKHLALERWMEAYALHRRAIRNRSQTAYHTLRIGIKRFRYIVENFLPEQHAAWSADLKHLQDLLGEVHDLDVLWATARQIEAFPDAESRANWHGKVLDERKRRIDEYRARMVGENSLWPKWRAELPSGAQVEAAGLTRLTLWGSMLDPDVRHSRHVAALALQLYDGLPARGVGDAERKRERDVLQVAALLHDVGRSKKDDNHHKTTFRLMERLKPPLGWTAGTMRMAAAVARYHRGALPYGGQKALAGFTTQQRGAVVRLAGVLRLANAMDAERDGRLKRVRVEHTKGPLLILAEGYSPRDRLAEAVAAGRHLLETIYRRPILIRTLRRTRVQRGPRLAVRKTERIPA